MPLNDFYKAHGLGNDYLVVDADALEFPLSPDNVRLLCDRRFGVGSDGVLVKTPAKNADFGLRIFNPDGSEAEKSGNGLRIFAKYLAVVGYALDDVFTVETPGGVVSCELHWEGNRVASVSVEMGQATFDSQAIPVAGPPREVVDETIGVAGHLFQAVCVSVGNPHCVIFVEDLFAVDLPKYGPAIENHELFPRRTNVQFAQVLNRERLSLQIWERGVGETMASGTSACAAAAAAFKKGLVANDVEVAMPGGVLSVHLDEQFNIALTGTVEEVCRGRLSPELVAKMER